MNATAEKAAKIVQELKELPAVIDTILLGRDGSIIAPGRDKEAHLKRFATACDSITGKAGASLDRFFDAGPESVVLKGKGCTLIVVDAGPNAILMLLVDDTDVLEDLTILAEMKAGRIKDLFI